MKEILRGECQCGCGGKTLQHSCNDKHHGYIKGEYSKFIRGHSSRGHNHYSWKGGRRVDSNGYMLIYNPNHPRSGIKGYSREHIIIAEKALGHPLPPGAVVHHHNGIKRDNETPGNLVICQDDPYHNLLHVRMKALKACGHANWRKCCVCHKYDDPQNLILPKSPRQSAYHNSCYAKYHRDRYQSKKRKH